jgi:hypothetical protein
MLKAEKQKADGIVESGVGKKGVVGLNAFETEGSLSSTSICTVVQKAVIVLEG